MNDEFADSRRRELQTMKYAFSLIIGLAILATGLVVVLRAPDKDEKVVEKRVEERFTWAPKIYSHYAVIVTDTKTNVKYLVVFAHNNGGIGITPLLSRPLDVGPENW